MTNSADWLSVGKILKTKGFDGTMIVSFHFPIVRSDMKAFFLQKGNQYTPLLVEKLEIIDEMTAHIVWKSYPSKETAQILHNKEIFMQEMLVDDYFDTEEVENFIGYEVYNREEFIGEVTQLFENNFQETLEVSLIKGKKLLIPLIEEYIETIDEEKQIVYCDLTDEYINLFTQ